METVRVGMREFRDKIATYVGSAEGPVAITRHGETVGYYLPIKRKLTEKEWEALDRSSEKLQREMARLGLTEEMLMEDVRLMREEKKQATRR